MRCPARGSIGEGRALLAVALLMVGGGAACLVPEPFGRELLRNGSFEMGRLTPGWALETGACRVVSGPDFPAAEGSFVLHGGTGSDCRVRQEVDLLGNGFRAASLDEERAVASASAFLRTATPTGAWGDRALLRLRFLDAAGAELASLRTLRGDSSSWIARTARGLVPPGTRRVRAELEALHRLGATNDGMVDVASLRVESAASPAPSVTLSKLPFLQDFRRDAMTVLWETDGNQALHAVEWGPEGAGLGFVESRVTTTEVSPAHYVHVAEIQGLSPATRYLYRVRSGATVSPTFAFRTAPQADAALRIAWFADNQDGPQVLAQHVPRIVARAPDLVLVPGDIVQQGDELWRWTSEWFDPLAIGALAQTTPILVARGNHDGEHAFAYAYTALPGNEAWYAFRYGDVFFVFLDTEAPTRSVVPDLDQSVFLEQALLAPEAQAAAFRVVAFHQPPYTNLWDSSNVTNCANGGPYDGAWTVRSDWVPLFESLGVDLVVSGHTHSYQHGQRNGVHYVLVGGGGGALDTYRGCNGSTFWDFIDVEAPAFHYNMMEVAAGTLVWTAYDTSDAQLHRFVIEQDP